MPRKARLKLEGKKFGRLTVVSDEVFHQGKHAARQCRCDCGMELIFRIDRLKEENPSCGCDTGVYRGLEGQKFGSLTVISQIKPEGVSHKLITYECLCDCGKIVRRPGLNLVKSKFSSCGCARKLGYREDRFYATWRLMKERCSNKKAQNYHFYGARGIYVCEEWKSFSAFGEWCHSQNPPHGYTLDRKDNDGPYSPENCKFSSGREQQKNRRNSFWVEYEGIKYPGIEFWEDIEPPKVKYCTFVHRVKKGMDPLEAATAPLIRKGRSSSAE